MYAMLLNLVGERLQYLEVPTPRPSSHEVLIKIKACGICRTDLHIVDGELGHPKLPLILGHQIVGIIVEKGSLVRELSVGQRIGVPWLGSTCTQCIYCLSQRENLCDDPKFTGYQIDGGLAEYCVADARFCLPLPDGFPDAAAAPLLCAGLIGYRALCKTGNAKKLGIYGFGAAAHILIQVAQFQNREVYAFTRPGDHVTQKFALDLGAKWAGDSDQPPPHKLDSAIIFAPDGELVPLALRAISKGGSVICGGIHMSDIPSFPYDILWGERTISSVANLTRADGMEFLNLANIIPIHTEIHTYPLMQANEALDDLRGGKFTGAVVITID